MTLAVDQPLLASDIVDVRDLKGGKIFLLNGRDGSSLILKAEDSVTGDQIKAVAPIIKTIDPSIKMKPLTPGEVLELKSFLLNKARYIQHLKKIMRMGLNKPITEAEKQAVMALDACVRTYGTASIGGRTNIAKMTHVNMSTLGIVTPFGRGVTDEEWDEARGVFRKFTKALNKSGGLEKLGAILAGDFFIGNEDRFHSFGSGIALKMQGESKSHHFKVIFNLGNIILVKPGKGKRTVLSMLDYMDPNTAFLNIDKDLDSLESTNKYGDKWPMRVLLNPASRKKIAEDLVDDLRFLMKPEKSLFGMNNLSGSRAVSRVNNGIVDGIKGIKKALSVRQAKLSPLIGSYYDAIKNI